MIRPRSELFIRLPVEPDDSAINPRVCVSPGPPFPARLGTHQGVREAVDSRTG
jgi:hypothetical protein